MAVVAQWQPPAIKMFKKLGSVGVQISQPK
jgi:hypothetical protein